MSGLIYDEVKVFLVFVLHGVCLLFASDLLRSLRAALPHGRFLTGLEDALFWFGAGIWTFILIFLFQDGVLRLYTAAALGIGMVIYRKTASRWVVKAVSGALRFVVGILAFFPKKIDIFCHKTIAKFVKRG